MSIIQPKKSKIIEFWAGPGTGKSTSAALLYAMAKQAGINAELVREYVKNWAWEKRHISTKDQIYFLGKQSRLEYILHGKVDLIVTDSPVLMGAYYARLFSSARVARGIEDLALAFYEDAKEEGHERHHVFLRRSKKYNPEGRYQTEDEARAVDVGVKQMMVGLKLPIIECDTDALSLQTLLNSLK